MSTLKVDTLADSTGASSTPINDVINGSARAWVNFNGTGIVAIRAGYNVSSITDNGTGDYTVNFTSAMSDANYCAQVTCDNRYIGDANSVTAPSVSAVRVGATSRLDSGGVADSSYMNVVIFR